MLALLASLGSGCMDDAHAACGCAGRGTVNLVVLGDSESLDWPAVFLAQSGELGQGDYFVLNLSVGGRTTTQMLGDWNATVKGRGYRRMVIMGGINDPANLINLATSQSNLNTIYSEAEAGGVEVIALTQMPAWSNAYDDQEQRIEDLRTYTMGRPSITVVDAWTSFGGPLVSIPLDGNDLVGTTYEPLYEADKTHPSASGDALLADLVSAALSGF